MVLTQVHIFTIIYLFIVLKEKDAALERWQEADQEIDRLQRELQVPI